MGNVPHNRGCGELMLGVAALVVVVVALCIGL